MHTEKYVLITGGTRGIGKAIANKFLKNGYSIIIVAKDLNRLKKVQIELKNKYPDNSIEIIACDLESKKAIYSAFQNFDLDTINLDIIVHNAGVFLPGELCTEEDEIFEKQMKINLFSIYYLNKILIESLKKAANPHMFFISSMAALSAYENGAAYSISKHALEAYILNLRNELKDYKIAITSLLPGRVWTDSWKDSGMDKADFIQVETIADTVFYAYKNNKNTVMEQIILNNRN